MTLEPCLMCLGAAITLGVDRVWYALESPNDGAHELLGHWSPPVEQPFFRRPEQIVGGIRRDEARELFAQYADGGGDAGVGTVAGRGCSRYPTRRPSPVSPRRQIVVESGSGVTMVGCPMAL